MLTARVGCVTIITMEIQNKQSAKELAGEVTAAAITEEPDADLYPEDEPLPLASGVGRRGHKAPAAGQTEGRTTAEEKPLTNPSPAVRPQAGIGRGGATAIAVLLLFIPLLVILTYALFDANAKIDGLQQNLSDFNLSANPEKDAQFAVLLSEPNLQILPLKAEDNAPVGKMVLYNAGRLRWGLSYGKLDPLPSGQMYVAWVLRKTTPTKEQGYERLAVMPDIRTGGRAFVLDEKSFPSSFLVANYSELVVTVEPVNQSVNKPTGPRRFSLDLAQVKE